VSSYVGWLAGRPEAEAALREPRARDFAGRDFSANAALALIRLTCGPITLTLPHEQAA
jgi:hypothetical protein